MTTLTPKRGSRQWPQALALETVRLGSAGLSASYYAMLGLVVHPLAAFGLGLIAFALDYTKGHVMRATADAPSIVRRLTAGFIFFALFLASMIAVDGTLMKLRSEWSGGRANTIGDYDRADGEYKSAKAELDALGPGRSTAEVRTAMESAKVSPKLFKATSECTRFEDSFDRKGCKPILDLRQEMATAIKREDLQDRLDAAKATLDHTERPASADPQADVIAKAVASWGVSPAAVAYLMVSIVGFAIELVACFGLWVLSRETPAPANENAPAASAPAPKGPSPRTGRRTATKQDPKIVAFVEAFRQKHGRNPTYPEMRSEFQGIAKTTAWRYQTAA